MYEVIFVSIIAFVKLKNYSQNSFNEPHHIDINIGKWVRYIDRQEHRDISIYKEEENIEKNFTSHFQNSREVSDTRKKIIIKTR